MHCWPRAIGTLWNVWRNSRRTSRSLERLQRRRLATLIAFARARSVYFRDLYRGLPHDVDDLRLLPPVTKPELMARFDDWVTDPEVTRERLQTFLADESSIGGFFLGKYAAYNTSGTTGERSMVLHDRRSLCVSTALGLARGAPSLASIPGLLRMSAGSKRRQATVIATGHHYPAHAISERMRRRFPRRARNQRTFSVLAPLPELVRQLNDFQPTILVGYPHGVAMLADERDAGRLQIDLWLVITFSEALDDRIRDRIARSFGCAVRDWYGAAEAESVAYDCGHGWMHVNTDWVILEPVDTDYSPVPPGRESSTVLLTNLANQVQPIIRYDLGDRILVHPERCPCGSPLPAIRVSGRLYDIPVFTSPEGEERTILPVTLDSFCFETAGVQRHQLLQTAADRLMIRFAAKPGVRKDEVWQALSRHLRGRLEEHGLAFVQLGLDPEPPRADPLSGKYRTVVVDLDRG